MTCPICLTSLYKKSDICKDFSPFNIHFTNECHGKKLFKTSCNHTFHKCCIFSYLWFETGCDIKGEKGNINCPYCKKNISITI